MVMLVLEYCLHSLWSTLSSPPWRLGVRLPLLQASSFLGCFLRTGPGAILPVLLYNDTAGNSITT